MAKRIGIWLFIAATAGLAAFNLYAIARGLATGGIPTLHKASGETIRYAAAPGAFLLNLGLRVLIALIFGGWSAMLLRDELRRAHRN